MLNNGAGTSKWSWLATVETSKRCHGKLPQSFQQPRVSRELTESCCPSSVPGPRPSGLLGWNCGHAHSCPNSGNASCYHPRRSLNAHELQPPQPGLCSAQLKIGYNRNLNPGSSARAAGATQMWRPADVQRVNSLHGRKGQLWARRALRLEGPPSLPSASLRWFSQYWLSNCSCAGESGLDSPRLQVTKWTKKQAENSNSGQISLRKRVNRSVLGSSSEARLLRLCPSNHSNY